MELQIAIHISFVPCAISWTMTGTGMPEYESPAM